MVRLRYTGEIPDSSKYEVTLRERNYAELTVAEGADEAEILRDLVDAGTAVRGFETSKLSLDDIFLRVYGDEADGAAGETPATPAAGVAA